MIQPNQAAVITLFGAYRGTERREGLRCCGRGWSGPSSRSARTTSVRSG